MSLPTSLPSASDPARTALPLRRTMPKPAKSDRPKPDRHFAWRVAPNLWVSFQYAWAGLTYAFQTQRNFRIHTAIAVLALTCGFGLGITRIEMAIVGLTCALVMVLELVNTALESVVDLTVQKSYHDLAKIAKDCADLRRLLRASEPRASLWRSGGACPYPYAWQGVHNPP